MKNTTWVVLTSALASLCIGICLLWWATALVPPWSAVVGALATIVVTLGVGNAFSDLLLQRRVSKDLVELVHSNRRLDDAGVEDLVRIEDADWNEFLSTASKVECAILNPNQFKHHLWPRLLEASRGDLHNIDLVFVDVSHETVTMHIAGRQNISPDSYAKTVEEVRNEVERQWKAHRGRSAKRSTLTIRITATPPNYAYVETPKANAILLEPMSSNNGFEHTLILRFRTERRGVRYAAWLTDSIAALRNSSFSAPVYSDAPKSTEPLGQI